MVTALESFATGIEACRAPLTKVQADFLTAQGQLGELGASRAGQAVLLTHAARITNLEERVKQLEAAVVICQELQPQ